MNCLSQQVLDIGTAWAVLWEEYEWNVEIEISVALWIATDYIIVISCE